MHRTIKKIIYYIIGTILLSLGITLSILSEIGAGAFDALNSNMSQLINISIGQAMYISIIVVYIIIMILKPKLVYLIGVLLTMLVGVCVDAWFLVIPESDYNISMRMLLFGLAIILLPLGVTFIIKSTLPLSPMDNMLIILVEKTKRSINVVKTLIEVSYAIIALVFGLAANIGVGALSFGTAIIIFTLGPGIGLFMKFIKDIDKKTTEVRKEIYHR